MEALNASDISTHYYKIGHINNVRYSVYQMSDGQTDQALLELELSIRYNCPNILLTYYNKGLYHFQFSHNPDIINLANEYPNLQLKNSGVVSCDALVNPSKSSSSSASAQANSNVNSNSNSAGDSNNNTHNATPAEESKSVDQSKPTDQQKNNNSSNPGGKASTGVSQSLGIGLLKAIKKLIIFRLSKKQALQVFGNYSVINIDGITNMIVYIDPMMLPNGDLLLCMIQKTNLHLYASSVLPIDNPNNDLDSNFVIYLTPSGIRCHLYDSIKILNSFTYTPPKNAENVLHLLKLATGVDLSWEENLLWVKLIPNLQHLNNQVSKISKFVHSVDNKKYILWPWKLCLLQFGKFEKSINLRQLHDQTNSAGPTANIAAAAAASHSGDLDDDFSDPLDLISEFMDFRIIAKLQLQQSNQQANANNSGTTQTHPSYSIPSVLSTGVSSAEHRNTDLSMVDVNEMSLMPDLFNGTPNPLNNDFFDNGVKIMNNIEGIDNNNPNGQLSNSIDLNRDENNDSLNDDEMDDLFGGDEDEDDDKQGDDIASNFIEDDNNNNNNNNNQNQNENDASIDKDVVFNELQQESKNDFSLSDTNLKRSEHDSSILDHGSSENREIKQEGFSTFDIPKEQMALSLDNFKNSTPYDDPGAPLPIMPTPVIPLTLERQKAPHSSGFESDTSSKSAFSPIVFNPLIRSNIDNKYGKGGKFYVDKGAKEHELNFPKLRATSVTGYELRKTDDDKLDRGLGIDFHSDSKVFSDSEEENESKIGNIDESDSSDNDDNDRDDLNAEEDEEEEEESDEDADINLSKESPLKLNTHSEPPNFHNPAGVVPAPASADITGGVGGTSKIQHHQFLNMTTFNTGGFSSPLSNTLNAPPSTRMTALPKFDSPFAVQESSPFDDKHKFSSPLGVEHEEYKRQPSVTSVPPTASNSLLGSGSGTVTVHNSSGQAAGSESGSNLGNNSGSGLISESSNCLPLILRGVNTSTIPKDYLLNNIAGAIKMSASASDFNMDVDQDDEDYDVGKKNEMTIKSENLNELLNCLGSNLIFDLGLNDFKANLVYNIPNNDKKNVSRMDNLIDGTTVSSNFEEQFFALFPLCYKIKLDEFLSDLIESTKDRKIENELDNQLSFLDDITNDEILNPKSKIKKLDFIEWDSIYLTENDKNEEKFKDYLEVLNDIKYNSILDTEGSIKTLEDNKVRVLKNKHDIINLNSISIKFWKHLKFNPISGPKNFQILLISEGSCGSNYLGSNNYNQEFLNSLIFNYADCNFGNISKISLQTLDTRPDLESINDGLILVDRNYENGDDLDSNSNYNLVYKSINKKLNSLVELIKLDLINKTNRFEFDRPLLLMVLDFNDNINSLLETSKIFRNFKMMLKRQQLPLVEVFSKIIPANFVIKSHNRRQRYLKYLSSYKLTKLSMNLYNQCPDPNLNPIRAMTSSNKKPDLSLNLFTNIVKDPLSKINFKFFNHSSMNKDYCNDDAFLHLAYERSIDKNWVSAAWSDPLGIVTYTKSWCNGSNSTKPLNTQPGSHSGVGIGGVGGGHGSHGNAMGHHTSDTNNNPTNPPNRNICDLQTISDQIFEISNDLFRKLNEEIIKRTSGLGGRKFLVLTRINSIIPDDELIHWKRLSMKFKDISLIVLSVNSMPKLLFNDDAYNTNNLHSEHKDSSKRDVADNNLDPHSNINDVNLMSAKNSTNNASNNVPGSNSRANSMQGSNSQFNSSNIIGLTIDEQREFTQDELTKPSNQDLATDFFKSFNNLANSNNPSPNNTNLITSPSANFNFGLSGANNFLSPDGGPGALAIQMNSANNGSRNDDIYLNNQKINDMILQDPLDNVTGLIPRASVPSFNCPTRAGMKVGILLKRLNEYSSGYLVFEINLLSCSNYWNLDSLMKVMLNHYKKLITLNDILGVRSIDGNFGSHEDRQSYTISGLIPWHIAAVNKSLSYLVHVEVED